MTVETPTEPHRKVELALSSTTNTIEVGLDDGSYAATAPPVTLAMDGLLYELELPEIPFTDSQGATRQIGFELRYDGHAHY